ncbi:glutathione S-transferase [Oleiphilus sp. HI0081]|nr:MULTISPECIES: glutathione S-transferase family protein [unclassified Oleiphilus]KZY88068.1 glutathione S-transferase [Oleiphilus sp. HI0072]KZZ07992.1 glutathione S-transferase [Oleiphilus sp. HI0078]KZZ19750.1 glutathione S-transferase [Oleiphilus sp. HI0081]KZY33963.1 glutathione S-transferase [Oleiphilus sp. HI0043]KZZ13444.1 glutathione S-transferase [Oleiphilus sp. HI0078]
MELVIGNQNYSSWSLRPWLLLTHFDIPFDEIKVFLFEENTHQRLADYSPTFKVPVLIDDKEGKDLTVWDSLAICEYVSEQYLKGKGWPEDPSDRATARAYCAEMHSGFPALRSALPMNCRATRKVNLHEDCIKDIQRIDGMWQDALNRHDGDWLFGEFSIADCMFAPVASRFATYQIEVSDTSRAYIDRLLTLPSMKHWYEAALKEKEVIGEGEAGTDVD